MKRDMELLRRIAFALEAQPFGGFLEKLEGVPPEEFFAHAEWMIEAGLATGIVERYQANAPGPAFLQRLTWQGCEFIDAVRDDTLWKRAKTTVLAPGASFTLDLVKEWFKSEVTQGFPTLRRMGQ